MEDYQLLTNLYNDEKTEMIKSKIEHLKNIDKLTQCSIDNLSSQTFRSCLTLTLFHSVFDKIHEHSHAGLHESQYEFNQYSFVLFFCKNGSELSFMIYCLPSAYM